MDDLITKIDEKYLARALEVSLKGTCLRKKVGAALIKHPFRNFSAISLEENFRWVRERVEENIELDYYHISSAANTTITGKDTCEELGTCLLHNGHCIRTIHAEVGCILNSTSRETEGAWIYISTAPCFKCFQEIAYRGIKRVVIEEDSSWKTHVDFEGLIKNTAKELEIEIWKKRERIV